MSKTDTNADYSRETILKKRKFPKKNAIILGVLVLIQILLAVAALLYKETPLDIIKEYNVTVIPYTDGKINVEYDILWQAKDEDEPLTWVEIGVPNTDFVIDPGSASDAVSTLSPNYSYSDSTVRVDLKES